MARIRWRFLAESFASSKRAKGRGPRATNGVRRQVHALQFTSRLWTVFLLLMLHLLTRAFYRPGVLQLAWFGMALECIGMRWLYLKPFKPFSHIEQENMFRKKRRYLKKRPKADLFKCLRPSLFLMIPHICLRKKAGHGQWPSSPKRPLSSSRELRAPGGQTTAAG